MIWDSEPWKADLYARAERIGTIKGDASEEALAAFEIDIFVGAYIIRRLAEADKLSNEAEAYRIPSHFVPRTGQQFPQLHNWHHVERFYDLNGPTAAALSLKTFCNQIIHSFVFLTHTTEDDSLSCLFVSDRDRDHGLHMVEAAKIKEAFCLVATDDIAEAHWTRNAKGELISVYKKRARDL